MTIKRRKLDLDFFIGLAKGVNTICSIIIGVFVLFGVLHYYLFYSGEPVLAVGFSRWIIWTGLSFIVYNLLKEIKKAIIKRKESKLK